MADLSQLTTEQLIALRGKASQPAAARDLSGVSTEDLMQMRERNAAPGGRRSWSELPENLGPSAYNTVAGFIDTIMHPEPMIDAIQGGVDRIMPQPVTDFMDTYISPRAPETRERQREISGAAGQGLKDRYGGVEEIRNTAITDPVGLGLDVAGLFAGGAGLATRGSMTTRAAGRLPGRMASRAMAGLDEATLNQADFLRRMAAQQGVDLTWPEAIQQASNSGTRLGDLQRVVENSDRGAPIMREFYADRPQQVETAARQQFDQIAPQPMAPERLGPRVQQAAEGQIDATQAAINQQTRPLYQAAEQQVLPPNHPALQDPAFIQAVAQARNDPLIGPRLAHLPDNSIGVIDEVQKRLRDDRNALRTQGRGYAASLTGQARQQVSHAARTQSPEYSQAVTRQAQLRDQHLSPLQEGPTGKLAGTTDVGNQTRALFPNKPQAQSEVGVARAMRGIGRADTDAAENIVRQHLETNFNEATQRLQSGANQAGGAKFSAMIAGNAQQRRNLFTAIRALPNGDVLWRGFSRFLDVMEATGKRPATNSMTDFNAQIRKELEQGPLVGEAATIATSPQKAMSFIADKYKQYRLGRGTEQLARLFTQGNVNEFRALLRTGPASARAIASMVRLLAQTGPGLAAERAVEAVHRPTR